MTTKGDPARKLGGTPPTGSARSRATFPIAALLFAPASVLGFMSRNLTQTSIADVVPALAGSFAFALMVWLGVAASRRRADAATAVIACLIVLVCLFYLGLFGPLNDWMRGDYTMVAALPLVITALILVIVAILRLRIPCAPIHVVLSTIAFVMVATPLWKVAAYEMRNGEARAVYDPDRAAGEMPQLQRPEVATGAGAARPPDIYHFVFDRYGSADVLARHYGVSRPIGDFLEARGFYVAWDSHSNYLKTGHSLASMFYMDYLDLLSDPRVAGTNWHPIFSMLDDHRAARFLRAQGYSFLQFGSWWTGTHHNAVADENHPYGFSEFTMYYLRRTILRALLQLDPTNTMAGLTDWDSGQCQRVARQVEQIKAIGTRPEPVYVFAHILVPHDPFVFAADGRCLTLEEANKRGSFQGYVDQIAYASKIIEDVVASLLADDRPPPIIIIQADEGPFPGRDYGVPWQDAPVEELRIKTGILNAYYFPGGDYDLLRRDVTPINSYRILFNTYFGTDFPILPDRVFAFPDDMRLFEFHDVTERIEAGADHAARNDPGVPAAPPLER